VASIHRGPAGEHFVCFDRRGFAIDPEAGPGPVVALSPRVERQWRSARRDCVGWDEFMPVGRRPGWPDGWGAHELRLPAGDLRFRCPACRRVNLVDMPRPCEGAACPHCSFAAEIARRRALWQNKAIEESKTPHAD
jgi:hypothetical protein